MPTKLRQLLAARGLGPDYLVAAKCGMDPKTFSEYLTGKRTIRAHHLRNICKVLGVDPREVA